jgi:hypothetical protein
LFVQRTVAEILSSAAPEQVLVSTSCEPADCVQRTRLVKGGMRLRNWLAVAALGGCLGIGEARAEQVQFKTMEMRTMQGTQEPEFIQVAHHRVVGRTAYRRTYYASTPHYVVKRRSNRKSAAIVGGSAGGGALIGALAGGGKGAAIGAVAGGGAGYLYDRKTHEKTVRVE